MVKHLAAAFLTIVLLSGCNWTDAARGQVAGRSANAADQALESGYWAFCEAPTIGALRRKYDTPEKFEEYLRACPEI